MSRMFIVATLAALICGCSSESLWCSNDAREAAGAVHQCLATPRCMTTPQDMQLLRRVAARCTRGPQ